MINDTASHPSLLEITRTHLHDLNGMLRQIDECLGTFSGRLPEPGPEFDPLAELRSGMDCVRRDLLADAIGTLNHIASLPEVELRERFEERSK